MALHSALPAEKPSRIVLAGDWHGDIDHAISAVRWASARGAQGILQLGDFGIWAGSEGVSYVKALNRELNRCDMWLGFVDGNHENFDVLNSKPVRQGVGRSPSGSPISRAATAGRGVSARGWLWVVR